MYVTSSSIFLNFSFSSQTFATFSSRTFSVNSILFFKSFISSRSFPISCFVITRLFSIIFDICCCVLQILLQTLFSLAQEYFLYLHFADGFRNDLSTQYANCSRIIYPHCDQNRTIKVVQRQSIWCQLQEKQIAWMLRITKMAKKYDFKWRGKEIVLLLEKFHFSRFFVPYDLCCG